MAFNSFLRRASASILPLEIGGSSAAAGRVIVNNVEKIGKHQQFLPFSRFSTTTTTAGSADEFLAVIESDYAAQRSSNNVKPVIYRPDGFPFDIEHIDHNKFSFVWKYGRDERIRVNVDVERDIYYQDPPNHPMQLRINTYVSTRNLDMEFRVYINYQDNYKLSVDQAFFR